MALISFFEDPLDHWRPSRLSDQRFGLGLDDDDILSAPTLLPRRIRRLLNNPYQRHWCSKLSKKEHGSVVACDKDAFRVNLDVQQFAPEEITVKATGDMITVEGKHEEKEDDHGYISRHFIRKYKVPQGHDIDNCFSKLSNDGVLTITAPKIKKNEPEVRQIPIMQTGEPARILEKKDDKDEGVHQMDISEGQEQPKKKKK